MKLHYLHSKLLGLGISLLSLSFGACSAKLPRVSAGKSQGADQGGIRTPSPDQPDDLGGNGKGDGNGGKDSDKGGSDGSRKPSPNDTTKGAGLSLFDKGLTLGLKKFSSCTGPDVSGVGALSSYVYFEVEKDTSDLKISFEGACAKNLDKVAISILDSSRKPLEKITIPSGKTTLDHTTPGIKLSAGKYIMAIEVPGTSESDISAFSVGKIKMTSTGIISHQKTQDY